MSAGFQKRIFTAQDGAEINYVDESPEKGDPILFVHGWLMQGRSFQSLAKAMSKKRRVLWIDLRGHGKTVSKGPYTMQQLAMDINELVEHLGLQQVMYVGFSMGAFVLFQYIRDFGCKNLRHAVVIDMPPKLLNDDQWKHGQYQGSYTASDMQRDLDSIEHDYPHFLADFCQQLLIRHTPDEERKHSPPVIFRMAQKVLFRNPPLAYWADMQAQDYRNDLSLFTIPLAILYAKPGSLFEEGAAEYIHACVPNSTLFPIENATHASLLYRTKELARILDAFSI